jgi:hypothetical protein
MLDEWTVAAFWKTLGHDVATASLPGGFFRGAAETAAEAGVRVLFIEPVTRTGRERACTIIGRFAIRAGADADFSRKLVEPVADRSEEWASWQVKDCSSRCSARSTRVSPTVSLLALVRSVRLLWDPEGPA